MHKSPWRGRNYVALQMRIWKIEKFFSTIQFDLVVKKNNGVFNCFNWSVHTIIHFTYAVRQSRNTVWNLQNQICISLTAQPGAELIQSTGGLPFNHLSHGNIIKVIYVELRCSTCNSSSSIHWATVNGLLYSVRGLITEVFPQHVFQFTPVRHTPVLLSWCVSLPPGGRLTAAQLLLKSAVSPLCHAGEAATPTSRVFKEPTHCAGEGKL